MTETNPFRRYRELRIELAKRFPNAIAPDGQGKKKRPLAIGIDRELAARASDISADDRALFFAFYTKGRNYRGVIKSGCTRIDLDGNEVVSKEPLRLVGADRVSP